MSWETPLIQFARAYGAVSYTHLDVYKRQMLADKHGRTLVVEPGIGWREDEGRYSLITNYSILAPERDVYKRQGL